MYRQRRAVPAFLPLFLSGFLSLSAPGSGPWAQITPGLFVQPGREEKQAQSNPLLRDAAAVEAGRQWFGSRCSACHGIDARGGSLAKDLYESPIVGRGTDKRLFESIRNGIPGTMMPPNADLPEQAIWELVSYLHALVRPGSQPPLPGNVEKGRAVYQRLECGRCHKIEGEGGVIGPDLSAVALSRTAAEIRRSVLEPNDDQAEGYRTVVLTTRAGDRVVGLLKNESNFSVQVLGEDGEYALFERKELREVKLEERSLMPSDYQRRLSDEELQDLLAFLDRRRSLIVESGPGQVAR